MAVSVGHSYPIPGGRLQPGSVLVFKGVIKDLTSRWSFNFRFRNDQKVRDEEPFLFLVSK